MAQGCRYDDDVLPGSLSVPAQGESGNMCGLDWIGFEAEAGMWARGGVRFFTLSCVCLPAALYVLAVVRLETSCAMMMTGVVGFEQL